MVSAKMWSAHRYLFLVLRRSLKESGWRQVQAEKKKKNKKLEKRTATQADLNSAALFQISDSFFFRRSLMENLGSMKHNQLYCVGTKNT